MTNAVNVAALGGGPVIVVKLSASQSVTGGTSPVIAFDTIVYDSNSNFNTSNYRFTPKVAGWYQVNLLTYISTGTASNEIQGSLQKNGSDLYYLFDISASPKIWALSGSQIIYCNGSTDYINANFYCASTVSLNNTQTYMSASLVRAG